MLRRTPSRSVDSDGSSSTAGCGSDATLELARFRSVPEPLAGHAAGSASTKGTGGSSASDPTAPSARSADGLMGWLSRTTRRLVVADSHAEQLLSSMSVGMLSGGPYFEHAPEASVTTPTARSGSRRLSPGSCRGRRGSHDKRGSKVLRVSARRRRRSTLASRPRSGAEMEHRPDRPAAAQPPPRAGRPLARRRPARPREPRSCPPPKDSARVGSRP